MAEQLNQFSMGSSFPSIRRGFAVREIILLASIAILFLLILVFAGLFTTAKFDLHIRNLKLEAYKDQYCTTTMCLSTASRALKYMNKDMDPCEDFYEYACGNYVKAENHGQTFSSQTKDVWSVMTRDSEDKLMDLLYKEKHIGSEPYITKLHGFFQSCMDMVTRQRKQGTPFLKEVIGKLGGWKVTGTWKEEHWNWQTALKTLHADYWVEALYNVTVKDIDGSGPTIVIRTNYGNDDHVWLITEERIVRHYKDTMRDVARLLVKDAKKILDIDTLKNDTLVDENIEEFVEDVFTVYSWSWICTWHWQPYYTKKVKIGGINALLGNNVVDWLGQLSYLFKTVTADTEIMIDSCDSRLPLQELTNRIKDLPESNRSRVLHNYFIWQIVSTYILDLSLDYAEVGAALIHEPLRYSVEHDCLKRTEDYMADALGALFLKESFKEKSLPELKAISDAVQEAVIQAVDQDKIYDDRTKKLVKKRIEKYTIKLGHPDWMVDADAVNKEYEDLEIYAENYFGNLMRANMFKKKQMNWHYVTDKKEEKWTAPVYLQKRDWMPYMNFDEILVTAGTLQFPLWDPGQPYDVMFGAFGTYLAFSVYKATFSWLRYANADSPFYFKQPNHPYLNATRCLLYNINEQNDYEIDRFQSSILYDQVEWIKSIRVAHNAYINWRNSRDTRLREWEKADNYKPLPGLQMTNEQVNFLAHAQMHCTAAKTQSNPSWYQYGQRGLSMRYDIAVNLGFGQLKEFGAAYHCAANSKMMMKKKCNI